ncbi:GNAT family N-acetyltransferase [Nocardioides pacificus]
MDHLSVAGATYAVARASREDLAEIVALLRDDHLGGTRELDELAPYETAFAAIDGDDQHLLVVVRDQDGTAVATIQLTVLPCLARGASTRLQIEAVRIAASARGAGLGTALFTWAHDWGRGRGAVLAQLTTDRTRVDAQRFYRRLGYVSSHEGLKLALRQQPSGDPGPDLSA